MIVFLVVYCCVDIVEFVEGFIGEFFVVVFDFLQVEDVGLEVGEEFGDDWYFQLYGVDVLGGKCEGYDKKVLWGFFWQDLFGDGVDV